VSKEKERNVGVEGEPKINRSREELDTGKRRARYVVEKASLGERGRRVGLYVGGGGEKKKKRGSYVYRT